MVNPVVTMSLIFSNSSRVIPGSDDSQSGTDYSDCLFMFVVSPDGDLVCLQLIKSFYNETYTERLGQIETSVVTLLWSLTTALYFPGGMIGAFAAGFLADKVGR